MYVCNIMWMSFATMQPTKTNTCPNTNISTLLLFSLMSIDYILTLCIYNLAATHMYYYSLLCARIIIPYCTFQHTVLVFMHSFIYLLVCLFFCLSFFFLSPFLSSCHLHSNLITGMKRKNLRDHFRMISFSSLVLMFTGLCLRNMNISLFIP